MKKKNKNKKKRLMANTDSSFHSLSIVLFVSYFPFISIFLLRIFIFILKRSTRTSTSHHPPKKLTKQATCISIIFFSYFLVFPFSLFVEREREGILCNLLLYYLEHNNPALSFRSVFFLKT